MKMRALRLESLSGPSGLRLEEVPEPSDADKVIIEVHAAGVSFADLLITRGLYQVKPEPPFTPGGEAVGIVRRAPPGSGFKPGDRVAAMTRFGAWAQVAAAPPHMTFSIPESMGFDEAVALPLNYQTSYFALRWRGQLRERETVLIHGAAGGVGSAAVQIARGAGATVLAVALGEKKRAAAHEAGAHCCIDAGSDWLAEVKRLTDGRGVDVVFDPVGGDRFSDGIRTLAPGGRHLVVGFAGGTIPTVAVNRLLLRNAAVVGVAWPEFAGVDPSMPRAVASELTRLWEAGVIRPILGGRYPLESAAEALAEIDGRRSIGKLVLRVREDA